MIAAVSIVLTLAYVAPQPKPDAPLTTGLPSEWSKMSLEFDRRLKQQFPIGTSEEAMINELKSQGFVRDDWAYQVPNHQEALALRSENDFVCNKGAFVYWRSDNSGKIISVRGEYREMGCL